MSAEATDKLERLYRRYGSKVQRVMQRQVGDAEFARDLTQETFLRAWRTSEVFDGRTRAWSWLNTIACRVLYDETTARRSPETVPIGDVPEAVLAWAMPSTDPAEILSAFDDAMVRLTAKERQALMLHHVFGLDRHEVAGAAGISTKGADSLMMRAKRALRQALLEQDGFKVVAGVSPPAPNQRRSPRQRSPRTWTVHAVDRQQPQQGTALQAQIAT